MSRTMAMNRLQAVTQVEEALHKVLMEAQYCMPREFQLNLENVWAAAMKEKDGVTKQALGVEAANAGGAA